MLLTRMRTLTRPSWGRIQLKQFWLDFGFKNGLRFNSDSETCLNQLLMFPNVLSAILGQNATFYRGTLEKMPSKDLQNCPRNVERSSSSEDSFGGPRTASFPESQGKRWHFNIIPWLCRFSSDQIQNDVIFQLFPPEISVTLR